MNLPNINWGTVVIQFAVLLFSLSIHEAAHAWMADRRGDFTARFMGRVSLNPIAHIDPIGTVLFPLLNLIMSLPLIGWAKPVPVNPLHLKDPSRDHMYISFAGPAANLLAGFGALISLLLLKWFVPDAGGAILKWVREIYRVERMMAVSGSASIITPLVGILFFMMIINFMLAIFNLLPVPPLDGHWILAGLLPPGAAESFLRFGRYGIFILYALMFMGIFRILLIPVGWLIQLLLIL